MDAKLMTPGEIQNLPASLPPPDDSSITTSPTSEQVTALASCSVELRDALGKAWDDALRMQNIPTDHSSESFFDLGGDANNAGQLAAHMQRHGYQIRIEDIFENPTWFELLDYLSKQHGSSQNRRKQLNMHEKEGKET